MNISAQIIKHLLKNPPQTEVDISRAKRKFCKDLKIKNIPNNSELLTELKKIPVGAYCNTPKKNTPLQNLLRKRSVRTLSGIAPIAVLTKPYPCPGACAYCPKEKDMPVSYLSNEPAVMRAILCKFNPYKQVQMRLQALQNNGHNTDKLELIVMGGTWSYLPQTYQLWYISECFRAANDFPQNTKALKHLNTKTLWDELKKQQKKNESAKNRIIGLTLETRPDYINEEELKNMRQFGCTRIEIGIQHIDNKILKLNKRGHTVEQTIEATNLMRQFGFKITYHIMPNLPGSTPKKDLAMCKKIFSDPCFQPDQIKLYPCVVARGSLLYHWWKQGKWKSYTTKILINLLINIKSITPPWVRIIRVIRDIPEESIIAGNKITNLRQVIQKKMDKNCKCIRCREAGRFHFNILTFKHFNKALNSLKLKIRKYKVINGQEYFLSFESKDEKILYAFCRLFLPSDNNTALIRELHTYGQVASLGQKGPIQHTGLGKKLLKQAEKNALQKNYSKISIISGIGVRNYYRKLGYMLKNTYMVKKIAE
ncbi:MAG: tRNA uridine(34) 5-carboxymethylaminomethyl modification radical SAM/GNAT enzyme Elp3 [Candidatus Kuenenbacteria bacterium]